MTEYPVKQSVLNTVSKNYANMAIPDRPILDCTLGVSPYGLPERVRAALGAMDPETIVHYPHDADVIDGIVEKFRNTAELTRDQILLSCGSFDALCKINKAFLASNSGVMGVAPRFSAYVDDVNQIGAVHRGYVLCQENGYRFDSAEFLRCYSFYRDCPLVCIENPHNPTGQIIPLAEIEEIAAQAERSGAVLLVDEAYGEYMPEENSAVNLVSRRKNVAVCRSFSKGYGMAGLRIGYLVTNRALAEILRDLFVPYDCNGVARYLACAMLQEREYCDILRRRTAQDKERILRVLTCVHAAATAAATPIMLLYHEDPETNLHQALLETGLLTVSGLGFEALGKNAVRMMVCADSGEQAALLRQAQERL